MKNDFRKQIAGYAGLAGSIIEIQFQQQTDNASTSFNPDDLSAGIYFVIVKNPLEIFVEKIFID